MEQETAAPVAKEDVISVAVPKSLVEACRRISARRILAGRTDTTIREVVSEAIRSYIKKEGLK